MITYEVIAGLCKERNIAITALEKELGFSNGSITRLKKGGSPSFKRLQKIADYFGVSVDRFTSASIDVKNGTPVDMEVQIQNLITALTGDNSVYYCGESMTDESRLALLNSLKRDMEFLYALHSKKDDE